MRIMLLLLGLTLIGASSPGGQDWTIPSGTTAVYDTRNGRLCLRNLHIEQDAILRVVGRRPFLLSVTRQMTVEGTLDLSGQDSPGVLSLNTTNQPEVGAPGQAWGGNGGVGSRLTTQSTPLGGTGYDGAGLAIGGRGGETSFSILGKDARRGAGGGGGALGPNQPVHPDPNHPSNRGLIAGRGRPGGRAGLGAVSQSARAQGGEPGTSAFVDGNPTNDFWGVKLVGAGTIVGELSVPLAGRGGGAGGDAAATAVFPEVPFQPGGDEKGAGGGGSGGLGLIQARVMVLGPMGRLRVDGGAGGGGENTFFFDRVGGGSGGGSGGMLVIEAGLFDLSLASIDSITALGGQGGPGRNNQPGRTVGAGGDGGPGLLQLHTRDGTAASIRLPAGRTLADLTSPDAHVLMPILGH